MSIDKIQNSCNPHVECTLWLRLEGRIDLVGLTELGVGSPGFALPPQGNGHLVVGVGIIGSEIEGRLEL